MPQILFGCLLGLAALLLLVILVGGYIGFGIALRRQKPPKAKKSADAPELSAEKQDRNAARASAMERFYALNPEDVALRSKDGTQLRGWFFPAPAPTRNLVIFSHGYHNHGPGEFADQLAFYRDEMGFHCLFPDHRAHGRSDGKYIGFGALEAPDLLDWAREYSRILGDDIEITLHGISMGAATVMLCAAMDPPPQVKRIIEDCGYTNAREQVYHTMKHELHIGFPPLLWGTEFWCRVLAGYSLKRDADPLGKMPKVKLPILFIHGDADAFVPFSMGGQLYDACTAPKDFLWVEGAEHAMAHHVGTAAYEEKLRAALRGQPAEVR